MNKKRNLKLILIGGLVLVLVLTLGPAFISKPVYILDNKDKAVQITLYNIEKEAFIEIIDKNKIEELINKLENIQIKKYKLVGNSSIEELQIIFYDKNGNTTIDTLFLSDKKIVYHHWLSKIVSGTNPYEELISEFEE